MKDEFNKSVVSITKEEMEDIIFTHTNIGGKKIRVVPQWKLANIIYDKLGYTVSWPFHHPRRYVPHTGEWIFMIPPKDSND